MNEKDRAQQVDLIKKNSYSLMFDFDCHSMAEETIQTTLKKKSKSVRHGL